MMRLLILSFFVSVLYVMPMQAFAKDFKEYFHAEPYPTPEIFFKDKKDRLYNLGQLKGKVILVNIWATWCQPCLEEMPALDKLQAMGKKDGIYIVPIAIDRASYEQIEEFYKRLKVKNLPVLKDFRKSYQNTTIQGLPSTLILNRKGEEVARVTGAIEWDSPKILEILKKL